TVPAPPSTKATEPVVTEPAVPTSTEAPPPVDEPPAPGPPAAAVEVRLSPDVVPPFYLRPDFPALAWTVTGAAAVRVEGPVGASTAVLSTEALGSVRVCPATIDVDTASICPVPPGAYVYEVIAFDGTGTEVARGSATLTVA